MNTPGQDKIQRVSTIVGRGLDKLVHHKSVMDRNTFQPNVEIPNKQNIVRMCNETS